MENSICNGIGANAAPVSQFMANIKKAEYLDGLHNVIRVVNPDGTITLCALDAKGNTIRLTYADGSKLIPVITLTYKRNNSLITRVIKPTWVHCTQVQVNGTRIGVNELIYQMDRLVNGLSVVYGEYNHFYPVSFAHGEVFSVNSGDVVSKDQNHIHWKLCFRIKTLTGLLCEVPSYGPAYRILGMKPSSVTEDLIRKYESYGWLKVRDIIKEVEQ